MLDRDDGDRCIMKGRQLGHAAEAAQITVALTESTVLAQALLARAVLSGGGLSAERTAAVVGPEAAASAQALERLGQLALPLILVNSFWTLQITIDRVLLSRLSEDAVGASMSAATLFWAPFALLQATAA